MTRANLEHIIRAAGAITETREIVIVGSQAILGSHPSAPAELIISHEADAYPLHAPEKADLIDGSIGEKSPFHQTFGYYAHGVSPETAILPKGWQARVVRVCNENTGGVTGLCLSAVDLAASKLAAGREKDVLFVKALLAHHLVKSDELKTVVASLEQGVQKTADERLNRLLNEQGRH